MMSSLKKKIWIGLGLLALFIMAALLSVFRFEVDVASALWALVAFVLIYAAYLLIVHWTSPKKKVTITTRIEFKAPPALLKKVQNYKLKVSSEKHYLEKGVEQQVKMDELVMSFNEKDHPDVHSYCMRLIEMHMQSCLESAERAHPHAQIIGTPLQLPANLKGLNSEA